MVMVRRLFDGSRSGAFVGEEQLIGRGTGAGVVFVRERKADACGVGRLGLLGRGRLGA